MTSKIAITILLICAACFAYSPSLLNFNGGDVSPLIEGRTDYNKYNASNRTVENMLVTVPGSAERRPGTYFVAAANGTDAVISSIVGGGGSFDYPQLQNILESYVTDRIDNIFTNIEVADPQGTTPISNETELLDIGVGVPLSGSYYLTQDIVVSGTKTSALIGSSGNYFSGTFDGRGHKITYTIDAPSTSTTPAYGLFYSIGDGSLIQNLLIDGTLTIPSNSGILSGLRISDGADSQAIIKNVHTFGTIQIKNTWPLGQPGALDNPTDIAGFIGRCTSDDGSELVITDCTANTTISLTSTNDTIRRIGGFVAGNVNDYNLFTNCHSKLSLDISTEIDCIELGGFTPYANYSTFNKCSSNLSGTADFSNTGGFIAESGSSCIFSECFSIGTISTNDAGENGGFIGTLRFGPSITDCYSKVDITDSSVVGFPSVGGFIGSVSFGTPVVSRCYCKGLVSSDISEYQGGFCGDGNEGDPFLNTFWDTETSGQATSSGPSIGKTTELMKTQDTYDPPWDFDTIWVMPSTASPTTDTILYANNSSIRLIPFTQSTDTAFMLEFGGNYIRFYKESGE